MDKYIWVRKVANDTVANYVNVGCYNDTQSRAITIQYPTLITSIEQAKLIATENNATVFGIQYGGYLFYSNNIKDAFQYGKAPNNDAQTNLGTGVGWVNDVWVLESLQTEIFKVINYVNIGCYNDMESRAISIYHPTPITSIEQAKLIAIQNNATVFGIQYGGQLFYSNNVNDAIKYGKAANNDAQSNLGAGVGWVNDVWVLESKISSIIQSETSL